MAKKKQSTGGKRMAELGRVPVQVWLSAEESALLRRAAALEERPLTQFVRRAALAAARLVTERGPGDQGQTREGETHDDLCDC